MNEDDFIEEEAAAPGWIMTFADLMSLLMCFFVLLLSFSELEAKKYKQVAGSMNEAFGVQREIPTKEIPKGTSIIAQEFSPGKPTRTVISMSMHQETTNRHKVNLDFTDSGVKGLDEQGGALPGRQADHAETDESPEPGELSAEMMEAAQALALALEKEIASGQVEIEALPDRIAIRVRERGSFASASAMIQPDFHGVLDRIGQTLGRTRGKIQVSGHTDDRPISTHRFPSNWELSAARAAAIVHYLSFRGAIDPGRMEIRAHGEYQPIADNGTPAGRAHNRRVEISLLLPSPKGPEFMELDLADRLPRQAEGPS